MGRARVRLGEIGEEMAVRALEARGYSVLARRYRRKRGEIDIVAADGPTIAFIEVKTRDGSSFGGASEAVTATKRRRIVAVARDYLVRHRLLDRPCRFDVVAIQLAGESPRLELVRNAFDATG